ncbi:MAG TPA: hypothetical protein DCR00_10225, partial [Gammaproteobacteria bacterium]|nr:hypothetical protein [Gammaproteobacteria bacterium]
GLAGIVLGWIGEDRAVKGHCQYLPLARSAPLRGAFLPQRSPNLRFGLFGSLSAGPFTAPEVNTAIGPSTIVMDPRGTIRAC